MLQTLYMCARAARMALVWVPTRARDLPSNVRKNDASRALAPYARVRTQNVRVNMCAQRAGYAEGAKDRYYPWRIR